MTMNLKSTFVRSNVHNLPFLDPWTRSEGLRVVRPFIPKTPSLRHRQTDSHTDTQTDSPSDIQDTETHRYTSHYITKHRAKPAPLPEILCISVKFLYREGCPRSRHQHARRVYQKIITECLYTVEQLE